MNIISPITFFDKLIKKNELGQPFSLTSEQREILGLAFAFDHDGRLPWDTIIYSRVKKSGKTTINGALTLYWGFTQPPTGSMTYISRSTVFKVQGFGDCILSRSSPNLGRHTIEIKRFEPSEIFTSKEEAEAHGIELAKAWVDKRSSR